MSCTDCLQCVRFKCLVLPQCPGDDDNFTIQIGVVEPETNYGVVFRNDSNGNIFTVSATSEESGLLIVELDSIIPYLTDKASFSLWVMPLNGQLHDYQSFVYEGGDPDTLAECASLRFEKVYGVDGFPHNVENQILIV